SLRIIHVFFQLSSLLNAVTQASALPSGSFRAENFSGRSDLTFRTKKLHAKDVLYALMQAASIAAAGDNCGGATSCLAVSGVGLPTAVGVGEAVRQEVPVSIGVELVSTHVGRGFLPSGTAYSQTTTTSIFG